MGHRTVLEDTRVLPGSVFYVHDCVCDRSVVELPQRTSVVGIGGLRIVRGRIGEQLECPVADHAGPLEGQIAVIPEAQLEYPAVVLGAARRDRLERDVVLDETS